MTKLIAALGIAALAMVGMACASQPERGMVGGKCTYRDYPGNAVIVSINPSPDSSRGHTVHVKFTFRPDEAVAQKWAYHAGKQYLMTLEGGRLPDDKYIEKMKIKVGAVAPVVMSVITGGTCTPIMFQWPSHKQ